MSKSNRLRIDQGFSTTFVGHSPQGEAVAYLNSGELDQRNGVGLAIAALFSPLGAMQQGCSQSEVRARIEECRRIAEGYWQSALVRAEIEPLSNNKPEVRKTPSVPQCDEYDTGEAL